MLEEIMKQISKYNITKTDIRSNGRKFLYNITFFLTKEEVEVLKRKFGPFLEDDAQVYINEYPLVSENIQLDTNNKVVVTIKQDFLPQVGVSIYFLGMDDFDKFEIRFLEQIKVIDLKSVTNKIKVSLIKSDTQIESPIFSTIDEKIEIPRVILEKSEFNHVNTLAIPNVLNTKNFEICKKKAVTEAFDMISEKKLNDDEFIISFERGSILNINKIHIDQPFYIEFCELLSFIFENPEKYYEKLRIFKVHFVQIINLKEQINEDDFKIIFKNLKKDYNLFIEDKINKYLSDKQKLTEDFTKLHREITVSIRNIISIMTQQILIIIGTVLTTFALKNFENMLALLISTTAALIYLGIVVISNMIKGWNFESNSINQEKNTIKDMFELLYSVEKEYVIGLEDKYKSSLLKLEKIEKLYKVVILTILFLGVLLFIWA
ncbi:hypothetical protein [Streptococcus merionis]|uniref:hypothetical protein n=1 Tax=Streptococcus merionis TaxID=400065 RepID=UPI0035128091